MQVYITNLQIQTQPKGILMIHRSSFYDELPQVALGTTKNFFEKK